MWTRLSRRAGESCKGTEEGRGAGGDARWRGRKAEDGRNVDDARVSWVTTKDGRRQGGEGLDGEGDGGGGRTAREGAQRRRQGWESSGVAHVCRV